MKYSAVIFDLDGTLINSLDDLADSSNEALAKFGFSGHSTDAYKKFIGNGLRQLVKNVMPKNTEDSLIDSILTDLRAIYNRNYLNKTIPYENILNVLKALKSKNIKMAICSNKPNNMTNEITEKLFGKGYFEVVFGEREGVPRKPDPASLIEAAEIMGVKPCDTIYLGDSGGDMICAVRAGMFPAGALWGFRDKEELTSSGAQILLSEPLKLLELI